MNHTTCIGVTRRSLLIVVALLVTSATLSGCSSKSWIDVFGERLCDSYEKRLSILLPIKDEKGFRTALPKFKDATKQYVELESERLDYIKNKNSASTSLDSSKPARLATRMDEALDRNELEVERISKLIHSDDAELTEGLEMLKTIYENPFNPRRNRKEERERKQSQSKPTL